MNESSCLDKSKPVLVICGPTASGKTSLALECALSNITKNDAEIVSADSMQIYKGLDVGTAKASLEERTLVPHHMIDVCEPEDYFSVAQYKKMASDCIRDIQSRNKLAIICGGTGQYLSSLIEGINYVDVPVDYKLREMLNEKAENYGNQFLLDELSNIDPETADRLSVSDRKRIIRALEIFYTSGLSQTEVNRKSRQAGPDFDFVPVCIDTDRRLLYDRINSRVIKMFENGWIEEVQSLISRGVPANCTSMQAIGYRQIISYLNNEISLESAIFDIQMATRRYAKRQLTWFRKMKSIIWMDYSYYNDRVKRLNFINTLINNK